MKSKEDKLDWTAQLVMLRDMTRRFETIHEAQSLQLRLWPYTVDPTINNSECKVDIENKYMEFNWTGATLKIDKKYEARLKTLASNVKFLLGDDWNIKVNRNLTTIYPLDTKNGKRVNRSRSNGSRRPNRSSRSSKRSVSRKGRRS